MKNIATFALFIAATFFATGPVRAQDHLVKATVPFSFTVGDRTLPSGNYTIGSSVTSPNLLVIHNWDKKIGIMSLGQPDNNNSRGDNTLVFHKYGNQYFLTDIRTANSSMNMHLPATKAEKRAKAEVEEAGLFANDPVLIALK